MVAQFPEAILKLMHYSAPAHEDLLLYSLAVDLRKGCEWLLELPEHIDVVQRFGERRNPRASRVHFLLAKEDCCSL